MRGVGLLLLPLIVFLAGCGLVDRAVDKAAETAVQKAVETATGVQVDENNGSVTIKGPDGKELQVTSAEGQLPEGFPFELHKGAKVVGSSVLTTDGKKAWTAQAEFEGEVKLVADYYEGLFKSLGVEVTRMDTNADGEQMVMLTGESGKLSVWTTISLPKDAPGTVTMIVGDK
jgi:hypothetical protein